jgi:hypothetical protein
LRQPGYHGTTTRTKHPFAKNSKNIKDNMSSKQPEFDIPNTEDLLTELRIILEDDELSEEKMLHFMNVFEALDNALVDGEPFPEDWLEERTLKGD